MTENNLPPFDYKTCQSVGEWKREVEKRGKHLSIAVCHPVAKFMKENNLTFPETYERLFKAGALINVENEVKKRPGFNVPENWLRTRLRRLIWAITDTVKSATRGHKRSDDPDDYLLDTANATLDRLLKKKQNPPEKPQ